MCRLSSPGGSDAKNGVAKNGDGVHLLPLALVEGAEEAGDEHVQLPNLLLVVILQSILVSLLQPSKGSAHLNNENLKRSSRYFLTSDVHQIWVPAKAT